MPAALAVTPTRGGWVHVLHAKPHGCTTWAVNAVPARPGPLQRPTCASCSSMTPKVGAAAGGCSRPECPPWNSRDAWAAHPQPGSRMHAAGQLPRLHASQPHTTEGAPLPAQSGPRPPPSQRVPPGGAPPPLSSPPMPVGNGVEVGTYHDTWQFLQEHGEADGWL